MHGPDLASRFQNLTTQQVLVRIPQDGNLVISISARRSDWFRDASGLLAGEAPRAMRCQKT